MQPQIIGISGSPIKNSKTDRLIKTVLESSGLSTEFVKPKLKVVISSTSKTWDMSD